MSTLNILTTSDYANGIPAIWNELLRYDATRMALTSKFEGAEGSKMPIIRQDDPSKKPGDTFHFQTLARLQGKGRTAAQSLVGYEEKLALGQFDLTVSMVRHAVAWRSDIEPVTLYKPGEWARPQLAEWYARKIMDDGAFYQMISTDLASNNTFYAGSATSSATLRDSLGNYYTLSVAECNKATTCLQSIGAEPYETTNDNGHDISMYGAWIDGFDAWHLKNDQSFIRLNEFDSLKDHKDDLRTGAIGCIGGTYLYRVNSIRGKGSPLRPECKIYGAHAADATTIVVGSEKTGIIDYTQYFPSSGYLSVIGNDGVVEYMTYSAKTTYSFTGVTRGVTYNGVTSVGAAYTGAAGDREFVTMNHFESSMIFFGAQALMRGFALTATDVSQKWDFEHEIGIGVKSVHGHKAVKNSDGQNRGYIVLKACSIPFDAKI
jgi:hypothetical protein